MQRPRIKIEHRPVRFGKDRVRIGGNVFGIAAELTDPCGWVWALLEALDGSRTVDQVVLDLVHQFPELPENDIRHSIDQLVTTGYLEEADDPPVGLTKRERERYGRSRAFFRWVDLIPRDTTWHAQLRLRAARVIVIGLGGAGGAAALALATSGVGRLHCVEPDIVELSNLNRQILYTEHDLGRPKADAAVDRLRAHNSDIIVTGERSMVTGPDSLKSFVSEFDVLVLGADQPAEIRSWANTACRATATPWVHGGYHGPQVTIGIYRPGTGPCYDCARAAETERRAASPPLTQWSPAANVTLEHAANAVSASIAGNLAAHAAISLLTSIPQLPINCQFGLNLVALDHSFVFGPDQPRSDCPTCRGRP